MASLSEEDKTRMIRDILTGKAMLMGKGGFGAAYYLKFNEVRYIIKQSLVNASTRDIYNNEVSILNRLSSSKAASYVPKYRGSMIVTNGGRIYGYIFMEFRYGDTLKHLNEEIIAGKIHLTEEEINIIQSGLPQALEALHAQRVLHLDIKPDNIWILMENSMTKRIIGVSFIDFGLSILSNPTMKSIGFTGGTPQFMSPKIKEALNLGSQRVIYNRTNNQYALDKSLNTFRVSLRKYRPVTPPKINLKLLEQLSPDQLREFLNQFPALQGLSNEEAIKLLATL